MHENDPLDFGLGLEWLVAAVPEALLIIGPDGLIEHANISAAHMFGYALDDLVGAEIETLVPTRLRARHVSSRLDFDRAPHDRPMSGKLDISALRSDGSEFPVDIELRPRRTSKGHMTIAVVRERGITRASSSTPQATAENAEIGQVAERSRPLLVEVAARLAELLVDAEIRHRDGRLPDSLFVETRRLVSTARAGVVELLRFIDDDAHRRQRDR